MSKKLYVFSALLVVVYTIAVYKICTTPKETKIELPKETELVAYSIQYESAPIQEPEEEIPEEIVNEPASEPEWAFDFDYVCRVVAAESRGEPYEGQVAVARCVWNTSLKTFLTPEEVVKQVNPDGTRQYTTPVSIDLVTDSVRDACRDAFLGNNLPTEEPIQYFYSGSYSKWHETALEYVITIGGHKFFKEK